MTEQTMAGRLCVKVAGEDAWRDLGSAVLSMTTGTEALVDAFRGLSEECAAVSMRFKASAALWRWVLRQPHLRAQAIAKARGKNWRNVRKPKGWAR